jgi:hypothetical protein
VLAKKPNNVYIFDAILILLVGASSLYFWLTEPSQFFKIAIGLLLLFSLWKLYKLDNSPLLFVSGFVMSTILFRLASDGVIPSVIAAIVLFATIIFLFDYRQIRKMTIHPVNQFFSIYNSLLGLLIAELYYVLTYFPIEAKNKAMLVVLFLWLYDECIESFEDGRLNRQFILVVSAIFGILFLTLVLTFPFQPGI